MVGIYIFITLLAISLMFPITETIVMIKTRNKLTYKSSKIKFKILNANDLTPNSEVLERKDK